MSFRDLVFHVLLISIVRSSTALPVIIYPKLLILWLSPELGTRDQEGLERIANRWKLMHSAFNAPQLETHRSDAVSPHDSWMFPDKYKYMEREREAAALMMDNKKILRSGANNMEMKENEKKNNAGIQGNSDVLPIRSKLYNDMLGTDYGCPEGERKDQRGHCKKIVNILQT